MLESTQAHHPYHDFGLCSVHGSEQSEQAQSTAGYRRKQRNTENNQISSCLALAVYAVERAAITNITRIEKGGGKDNKWRKGGAKTTNGVLTR